MASIEERRQIVKTHLKEVHDSHESIKEDIEVDLDSLGDDYRLLVIHERLIKVLEKRLERLRNSGNTSSDKAKDSSEPEDDSEPEENGEEGESDSDAISEADSDNSSESDGAKKRRRDESEDLESDQENSFSKTKRSRHHAGGYVSAFDEEDLKLVRFFRRMSQLSTKRQIESFKWIHPIGQKMMLGWMDMVESFQNMAITAAKR
ncbi:hypothetical protein COL922a_005921 [Colletotrichum nupharicola]|nr:hypothetical protein COL922a_005921 [Colletotrichum nupharicola]